jgi:hypothetical protein
LTFSSSTSLKVSVLLLFSFGTILFFNLYERYVIIGPELIINNHFHNNLAKWEYSDQSVSVPNLDDDIVRLHSDNPAMIVGISQTISDAAHYPLLRFSCDIKTNDVPPGRGSWNTARVILVSHDQKGIPMWHLPHALAALRGTRDWEHHERVFAVAPDATGVSVFVQLAQTTGTMWVKDISLQPVMENASFHKFRGTAVILWTAVVLWIAVPMIRSAYGNPRHGAILVLGLAILLAVLMPENLKEHLGSSLFPSFVEPTVTPAAASVFKFTPLLPELDIYKAGHFFMFAMLAVAALYRRPYPVSRTRMLVYLLLFALVTEILQLLVSGRSAQLGDVLVDGAGMITGLMLLRLMQFFSQLAPD